MRFDVVTLFPDLFTAPLSQGVTRRAFQGDGTRPPPVEVRLWQLRDFTNDAYHRVDDRPYGGGPGMVMLYEPLARALEAVRASRNDAVPAPVVSFSPAGQRLDQRGVRQWAGSSGAVLVCGRYEGIDQRFVDRHVDVEISLGDFVLSGGELPALALLDGVARLQDGVLHDARSHAEDSFSGHLLDHPHYSRPEVLAGEHASTVPAGVPEVLKSGNHAAIDRWRREQALDRTSRLRPELIEAARRDGALSAADETVLKRLCREGHR